MRQRFVRASLILASYVLLIGARAHFSGSAAQLDNGLVLLLASGFLAIQSLATALAVPRAAAGTALRRFAAGTSEGAELGVVYALLIMAAGVVVPRDDHLSTAGLLVDTVGTAAICSAILHGLAFARRRARPTAPSA